MTRARACVQRGQIDAALKLYKGLLLTFPNNPQVNTELGVLSLHHRPPEEAIKPLEKAVSAWPLAFELWVFFKISNCLSTTQFIYFLGLQTQIEGVGGV
jgi:predicted Zn-dependent protease